MSIKEQTKLCKQHISNRESVRDILSSIGYEITPQYRFKNDDSISIRNDGYIKDFSNSFFNGGDLLDFFQVEFSETLPQSVERLSNILGIDSNTDVQAYYPPIKKKTDKESYEIQQNKSKRLEIRLKEYQEEPCFSGNPGYDSVILNDPQLFQRDTINISFLWKLKYLSENILGYDKKYQCTKIILRDIKNNIVDMVNYRPKDQQGKPIKYKNEKPIKYYQLKNEEKPIGRGDYFLYPFQLENEELLKKNDYLLIGEGLKNSINALLYDVPYLSIESVSNRLSDKLISYIHNIKSKGIELIGAFDGDVAGAGAYKRFCESVCTINNIFSFNSNEDFTDYIIKRGEDV